MFTLPITAKTAKARQVRCLFCKRLTASARYPKYPHGTNIYSWIDGGTLHAKCVYFISDYGWIRTRGKAKQLKEYRM